MEISIIIVLIVVIVIQQISHRVRKIELRGWIRDYAQMRDSKDFYFEQGTEYKRQVNLKSAHIRKQKQAIKILQSNNTKLFNLISNLIKTENEEKSIDEIESLIASSLFTGKRNSTN